MCQQIDKQIHTNG